MRQHLPSWQASAAFVMQLATQLPFSHFCAPQECPQVPQFDGSVSTSVQSGSQSFCPGGHWHMPLRQA
jgi:hypothetical protein